MSKKEFLDTLRTQLEGELSQADISGHIQYYKEFIEQEVRSGKSERQVIQELGSPVFIAKTILDTSVHTYEGDGYQSPDESVYENEEGFGGKIHTFHISPFVAKWIIPIVIVLVVFLALTVFGTALALVIRYFLPIILIWLVFVVFKNRRL